MAQSRPPPSRVQTTPASSSHYTTSSSRNSSPPPHSPRTHSHHHGSEKRHHVRRKSGRSSDHVTTNSDKKSSSSSTRPNLNRKQTPQHTHKSTGDRRSHRDERDRERDEERRDSGECFAQFCMSCEKQFVPASNTFLYCSEACRVHDLNPSVPTPIRTTSYPGPQSSYSPPLTPYGMHFPTTLTSTYEEGPDIIPRFSPTISRPRSYFSSDPYPASYQPPPALSASVPHKSIRHGDERESKYSSSASRRTGHGSTTALESLREIAGALPKVDKKDRKDRKSSRSTKEDRHSKDSSDDSSSIRRNGSAVWSYIPFTTSSSATTPAHSYTQSSIHSYQHESSREDLVAPVSYSYGNATSAGVTYGNVAYSTYGVSGGMGMDRPLPPRGGPGHRPKSIDLVTPFATGH